VIGYMIKGTLCGVPFIHGMSDSLSVDKPQAVRSALGFDPVAQPWEPDPSGLPALAAPALTPNSLRRRFQTPPDWSPEVADDSRQAVLGRDVLIAAAVLMPLVMRPQGLHVLL